MVWARLLCSPNRSLHEAHVLGALVGRDGADLLLRYFNAIHGRLRLLPKDVQGALLRGLLP